MVKIPSKLKQFSGSALTPAEPASALLNSAYSKPSMRRRYEVWFLRFALADGSGAWWFRCLLMNLGRGGCESHAGDDRAMPGQVWATFFPRQGKPETFIRGFALPEIELHAARPFSLRLGESYISEDQCSGRLQASGQTIAWNLRYSSSFGATLSNVGWIGFSRTPHSNATFSGEVRAGGRVFSGEPLGYGLQGHNCGYRHRNLWTWSHAHLRSAAGVSTFEALVYEIPLGMRFRKALFWHEGRLYTFRKLQELRRERDPLRWILRCEEGGNTLEAEIDGAGPALHRLPYWKTDCSGTFEVCNNSLARARIVLSARGRPKETLSSEDGAVLEMTGE